MVNFSLDRNEGIVRQILARQHVSLSNRQVVKNVIACMSKGLKTWKLVPKEDRKKIMQFIIAEHLTNTHLYVKIMLGKVGRDDENDT